MTIKNATKATTPAPLKKEKKDKKDKKDKKEKEKKNVMKEEEDMSPTTGIYGWTLKLLAVVMAMAVTYYLRDSMDLKNRAAHYIARTDVTKHLRFNLTCAPMEVRL